MSIPTNKKALVVFSGGQDSTTCLYWAIKKFCPDVPKAERSQYLRTITFEYGQRHSIELEAAKTIVEMAGLEFDLVKVPDVLRASNCSLLNTNDELPTQNNLSDFKPGIANTFVPARNILFLTLAANIAMNFGTTNIITGVCQTDFAGYYDCRQDFIHAMQTALNQGCYGQNQGFTIHTPLMDLNKAQTVQLAVDIGEECMQALAYTHTCYSGVFPPCMKCHACHLRARGFYNAGIEDPLLVRALNYVED